MSSSMIDMLSCCKGQFVKRINEETWEAIPLCLMWSFWTERNIVLREQVTFNDVESLIFEDYICVDFSLHCVFYLKLARVLG